MPALGICQITVRRTSTGWSADFAQHPDGPRIQKLFGTTELPTAYTPRAEPEYVLEKIQARNPEAVVLVLQ